MSNVMSTLGLVATPLLIGMVITGPIFLAVAEREIGNEEIAKVNRAALFQEGDMVRMKAFGHTGQVVGRSCGRKACSYSVRFSAMQSSEPFRILGSGGNVDVAPVAIIKNIREYELEKNPLESARDSERSDHQ